MRDGGKGDKQRPLGVPKDEFDAACAEFERL